MEHSETRVSKSISNTTKKTYQIGAWTEGVQGRRVTRAERCPDNTTSISSTHWSGNRTHTLKYALDKSKTTKEVESLWREYGAQSLCSAGRASSHHRVHEDILVLLIHQNSVLTLCPLPVVPPRRILSFAVEIIRGIVVARTKLTSLVRTQGIEDKVATIKVAMRLVPLEW